MPDNPNPPATHVQAPAARQSKPKASALERAVNKIKAADSILVALSDNPDVDQMSAAIALTMLLDSNGKHATAIFSGKIPNAIKFLKPEETFEKDTNSLQDFIVALNKEKADHIRYMIEGDFVKIYITPYRTTIDEGDLEFSHGDYNVDLVIAFDVKNSEDLDDALSEYGRIMHDATAINISNKAPGRFAELEWTDDKASSVCEMVVTLMEMLEIKEFSPEVATALLTGVVASTEHFSNNLTSPETMTLAAKLMSYGADQQLISANVFKEGTTEAEPTTEEAAANPEANPAEALESTTEVAKETGATTEKPQESNGAVAPEPELQEELIPTPADVALPSPATTSIPDLFANPAAAAAPNITPPSQPTNLPTVDYGALYSEPANPTLQPNPTLTPTSVPSVVPVSVSSTVAQPQPITSPVEPTTPVPDSSIPIATNPTISTTPEPATVFTPELAPAPTPTPTPVEPASVTTPVAPTISNDYNANQPTVDAVQQLENLVQPTTQPDYAAMMAAELAAASAQPEPVMTPAPVITVQEPAPVVTTMDAPSIPTAQEPTPTITPMDATPTPAPSAEMPTLAPAPPLPMPDYNTLPPTPTPLVPEPVIPTAPEPFQPEPTQSPQLSQPTSTQPITPPLSQSQPEPLVQPAPINPPQFQIPQTPTPEQPTTQDSSSNFSFQIPNYPQ